VSVQADAADDSLTRIAGIEAHVAAQLRQAGIHTVDDLAWSSPEQVAAACGSGVAANARAQGWIEQAAEFADRAAAAAEHEAPGQARVLPRRTFTVEVWIDTDADQVVTTRVVRLETQDAAAWSGWSRSRLLDFMETRTGVAIPAQSPATCGPAAREHGPTDTGPAVPAAAPDPRATTNVVDSQPAPPTLIVHRFGVLKAATPAMRRGETAARLRLDPAELGLRAGLTEVAQVELLAKPLGAGRAKILDTRVIDLAGRAVDAVLPVRLPEGIDPPFAVLATVKVLADQPTGQPTEGLGNATLDLVPGGAATA
jgi:hypothetical protein